MLVLTLHRGEHITVTTDATIPAGSHVMDIHCGGDVLFARIAFDAERYVKIVRSDAKRPQPPPNFIMREDQDPRTVQPTRAEGE